MRCKNCKAKLPKEAAFCPVCRTPVKKRRKWPFVLVVLLVVAAVTAAVLLVAFSGVIWGGSGGDAALQDGGSIDADSEIDEDEVIEDYVFDEEVIEEITASTSSDVLSVAEVVAELESRGFADVEIEATYDLEGNLLDDMVLDVDTNADEKYPIYNVYYTTEDGNLWALRIYNGSFMADPLFAYELFVDVPILIIEDEHVTSYKASEDLYIVSDLAESELVTKHIDAITAEALESLSAEDIDAL